MTTKRIKQEELPLGATAAGADAPAKRASKGAPANAGADVAPIKVGDASLAEIKTAAGRANAQRYLERKREALKWERSNFDKISLIKGQERGWMLFNNSAVIFRYHVVPMLKKKNQFKKFIAPAILMDRDKYDEDDLAKIGVMTFSKKSEIVKAMTALGLERIFDKPEAIGWRLDKKLAEKEYAALLDEVKEERERVNKIILTEESMPDLAQEVKLASEDVYHIVRKMNIDTRELLGKQMVKLLVEMRMKLLGAERGWQPMEECLDWMKRVSLELDAMLLMMIDLGLEDMNVLVRASQRLASVRSAISSAKKKVARKEKAKSKKGGEK